MEVSAYITPLDRAIQGIIYRASNGESPQDIPRNPLLAIVQAWDMGRISMSVLIHFMSNTLPESVSFSARSLESTPSGPKWRLVRIADGQGIEGTSAQNACVPITSTADNNTRLTSSAPPLALRVAEVTEQATYFVAGNTSLPRPNGPELPHHFSTRRRRTFN
ncbi:hypothetical protein MTO96_048917 [Rhipicephalus appendiculatus]